MAKGLRSAEKNQLQNFAAACKRNWNLSCGRVAFAFEMSCM
jgi:hypothetical protein